MTQRTLLFSGHMIDAPDRAEPRFPPQRVAPAQALIERALADLGIGADDLAITQGACGGDLLFSLACQARGTPVQWMQPFREREFTQRSVEPGGHEWLKHYLAAKHRLAHPILTMPEPGPGEDPYEKCNRWMIDHAHARGVPMHLLCLWDGKPGNPGGTAHFVQLARAVGARVHWVDTRSLEDEDNRD